MGHVNQKGASGQKAPVGGQKGAPGAKGGAKSSQKPTAQKGQVKVTPKAASVKTGKNKKKGQRQQYDLIVTINLVSDISHVSFKIASVYLKLIHTPRVHNSAKFSVFYIKAERQIYHLRFYQRHLKSENW